MKAQSFVLHSLFTYFHQNMKNASGRHMCNWQPNSRLKKWTIKSLQLMGRTTCCFSTWKDLKLIFAVSAKKAYWELKGREKDIDVVHSMVTKWSTACLERFHAMLQNTSAMISIPIIHAALHVVQIYCWIIQVVECSTKTFIHTEFRSL